MPHSKCKLLTPSIRLSRRWLLGILLLILSLGCDSGEGAAVPAPNGNSPSAGDAPDGIPAELVTKVEELIRLTGEYNALAAQILDVETFKLRRDELSEIENRLSPIVEDVMIAQAKLTSEQSVEFDRTYYDTRAKPLIDAKSAHQRRIHALVP